MATARQTGAVVAAAGDGRVASAARADYAAAAAAVLSSAGHEGRIYELSGDYAWDFKELATAITEIAGREVVYQPVSAPELVEVLTTAGLDQGTAGFLAALDTDTQAGSAGNRHGRAVRADRTADDAAAAGPAVGHRELGPTSGPATGPGRSAAARGPG